jgi:hypothetical protein
VAYESFVENFVNAFAIVDTALWLAHHARAFGWRNGFGHDTPQMKHSAEPIALR